MVYVSAGDFTFFIPVFQNGGGSNITYKRCLEYNSLDRAAEINAIWPFYIIAL